MQARVLMVASEAVPLIKTGGLADVITALASALRMQGVDAGILLPGYPAAIDMAVSVREVARLPDLPGGGGRLLHGYVPETDVPVTLLDTPAFRDRSGNPYLHPDGRPREDNAYCFADLAHAAVAICAGATNLPVPHVVHANDWHAGLIPTLLHARGIRHIGSVLTIHNLAFQGNFPMTLAETFGVPVDMLTPDGAEFWGQLGFLKGGIRYADRITTVSESYAREILTPRFGNGMDGILNARHADLVAIPNGADVNVWNPATDPQIARRFSANDLRGKSTCKRDLQRKFGLPVDPFAPVLALGSRMTHQKMADVALASLPQVLSRHPRLQVTVHGCGDLGYEEGFRDLARRYPERVGVVIGYDEALAHALHAGADMLLHGTRFEPYGLTPIYAMRYGTLPVGSRVGGLIDTVCDSGQGRENARGILFNGETPEDMTAAMDRAFSLYAHAAEWSAMQRNAMTADFSWNGPAAQYIALYRDIAPAGARDWFAARPASSDDEMDVLHYKRA